MKIGSFLCLALLAPAYSACGGQTGGSADSEAPIASRANAVTSGTTTQLDIFPSSFGVAPAWTTEMVTTMLTSPTATGGIEVLVSAGGGVQVSCTGQAGPFLESCKLPPASWSFSAMGSVFRARRDLWLQRTSTDGATTTWGASVEHTGVPTMRHLITLSSAPDAPPREVGTLPARFRGYVTLNQPTPADNPAATYAPLSVPVEAWVHTDGLRLFDASRTISKSGELTLDRRDLGRLADWDEDASGAVVPHLDTVAGDATEVTGGYTMALAFGRSSTGDIPSHYGTQDWTFFLERDGALPAGHCPCGSNEHCVPSIDRCRPGPAPVETYYRCNPDRTACATGDSTGTEQPFPAEWASLIQVKPYDSFDSPLTQSWLIDERRMATFDLEGPMCADYATASARGLGTGFLPISGDRACEVSGPPRQLPIFTHRDRGGVLDTAHMLRKCVSELNRPAPHPPFPTSIPSMMTWAQQSAWLNAYAIDSDCANLGRFLPLLDVTYRRPNEFLADGIPTGLSASGRMFGYLVNRWIQLHSFVAMQGREELNLNERLADLGPTNPYGQNGLTPPPTFVQLFDLLKAGWGVLRDREYLNRLADISAAELREPDYRAEGKPLAYWPFDSASLDMTGMRATEVVGGRHAVLAGNGWSQVTDGGLQFSARGRVDLPIGDTLPDFNAVTLSMWFRPDEVVADVTLPSFAAGKAPVPVKSAPVMVFQSSAAGHPATIQIGMETSADGVRFTYIGPDGGNMWKTDPMALGQWHRITIERGGFWVDQAANVAAGSVPTPTPAASGQLVVNPGANGFHVRGAIADVAIFDSRLTYLQAQALAASGRGTRGASRLYAAPSPDSDKEFGVPVAVGLLEGLSSYLQLAAQYDQDLRAKNQISCLSPSSSVINSAAQRHHEVMAAALTFDALTSQMWERASRRSCEIAADCGVAGATCESHVCMAANGLAMVRPDLAWKERWYAARREFAARRAEAMEAFAQLAQCDDVSELPPKYVPVVFPDGTQPNERFFATSRHFVNTWAFPAIQQADTWLQDARAAWIQQLQQQVQAELGPDQVKDRMLELKRSYGREITAACGLTQVLDEDAIEALSSGNLRPENCFVEPQGTCIMGSAQLFSTVNRVSVQQSLCTWDKLGLSLGLNASQQAAAHGWNTAQVSGGSLQSGGVSLPLEMLYLLPPGLEGLSPEAQVRAAQECAGLFHQPYAMPSPVDVEPGMGERAECYRGTIGVEALNLFAARRGIDAARSSWEATVADYDTQMLGCVALFEHGVEDADLRQAHRAEMDKLRDAKRRIDEMAAITNAIVGGASLGMNVSGTFATPANGDVPASAAWKLGTGAALTNAALEIWLGHSSRDLDDQMTDAQNDYDDMMALRAFSMEVQQCFDSASRTRHQFPVARSQVQQRVAELEAARGRLKVGIEQVAHSVVEGRAAVLREQGRTIPMVSHHYWLNEYADRYQQQLEFARKLLYLGLLAVEYEYQKPLPAARDKILTAQKSADLGNALVSIQQIEALQSIGGKPVGQPYVKVLGLREQILKLTDIPGGKSAVDQLRDLLSRREAEVWYNGRRIGSSIRFTLTPEMVTPDLCAERLWGVGARLVTLAMSGFRENLRLYKSNNFYSNCCRGQCDGQQTAQVNPSIDPFGGDTTGDPIRDAYSSALINAQINGAEGDFFNPAIPVPLLTQFAGRGIGGEYVLVIPWDETRGALAIPIEKLLNVQLRFEFYAIDNAPPIGGHLKVQP